MKEANGASPQTPHGRLLERNGRSSGENLESKRRPSRGKDILDGEIVPASETPHGVPRGRLYSEGETAGLCG
jgi:hypothetical protein